MIVMPLIGTNRMSERLLIVDEDESSRAAMAKILGDAGFDIVQARDSQEALPIIADGQPLSLLIIDLVLPGVNGLALARLARLKRHGLKVVYLTSTEDVTTNETGVRSVAKSIKADMLVTLARAALDP
jgi:DNA-binding response OmpR family regulator